MPRLRSVVVVVLIWIAAFAASSAPDGFGGAARTGLTSDGAPAPGGSIEGKRWAAGFDPAGKRWDWSEGVAGKRWD